MGMILIIILAFSLVALACFVSGRRILVYLSFLVMLLVALNFLSTLLKNPYVVKEDETSSPTMSHSKDSIKRAPTVQQKPKPESVPEPLRIR